MPTTIVDCVEIYDGQSAVFDLEASKTTFPRKFLVTLSAPDPAGPYLACYLASAVRPSVGDPLFTGSALVCLNLNPQLKTKSRVHYIVTANYGIRQFGNVVDPAVAPWDRPTFIDTDTITRPVELAYDRSVPPVKVLNTAKMPYRRGIMDFVMRRKMTVRFALQSSLFDYNDAAELVGTVNFAELMIDGEEYRAGQIRCLRVSAPEDLWRHPTTGAETLYRSVVIELEIAGDEMCADGVTFLNHDVEIPSTGLIQIVGGELTPCLVQDNDGFMVPATQDQFLDVNGAQIPHTDIPDQIYFKLYTRAIAADWTPLQLPAVEI